MGWGQIQENVNIGFHPLELKTRPLSQTGAEGSEGNNVKGGGSGEAKQERPENRGRWVNTKESRRVVGEEVGDISCSSACPLK